jgi:hypothetical protein
VTKTTTGPSRIPTDDLPIPSRSLAFQLDPPRTVVAGRLRQVHLMPSCGCLVAPGLPDRLPPCCGSPLARPVRHPAPQEAGRGWGQVLGSAGSPDGLGSAGPWPVSQAGKSLTGEAAPPGDHRRSGDAQPLADLGVGDALSRQQKELGPAGPARPGLGGPGQLAKGGQVVRGNGEGSSNRHGQNPVRPPTVKSRQDGPLAGSAGGCSWHVRC